jgi:hypothetical protein
LAAKLDEIIQEWVNAGLVIAYTPGEDPVLFFTGFRKNNSAMRYERESASIYPPPPGHHRTPEGLEVIQQNATTNPPGNDVLLPDSGSSPAVVRQESGSSPAQIPLKGKESKGKEGNSAREPDIDEPKKSPPPTLPRKPVALNGHTSEKAIRPRVEIDSPHVEPRKFVNGFIPVGKGSTAVEVYYERFSIDNRLSDPLEEDLIAVISDLDKWRSVVIAWQQAGYNPKNISGQLDWYKDGIPKNGNGNGKYPAQAKQEPAYKRVKQL